MTRGFGYHGPDSLKTSVGNEEILPVRPEDWTMGYHFYKFGFMNDQACRVIINNNGRQLFLRAGQGFEMDSIDAVITSFKIVEPGITYNWIGAY